MTPMLAYLIGVAFLVFLWGVEILESKPAAREWAERMADRILR